MSISRDSTTPPSHPQYRDAGIDELELDIIKLEKETKQTSKSQLKKIREELKIVRNLRWSQIEMGILQTILTKCFKNISHKTSVLFALISNIIFSLFDTGSDFAVAFKLFANGEWWYGIVVLIVDYLPGWELLIHNLCSENWRMLINKKEWCVTILFLLVSPFSLPLFFISWLLAFNNSNKKTFDYLHHNARLSQLLVGSVESPLQVMFLLVLWAEEKITVPWSGSVQVTDSLGRNIDFGIFPGMLSFIISIVVILKGSLEIAESKSLGEQIIVCGYAICNFVFRLGSFALAIIYFREWSIILFVVVTILNVTCIIRYDLSKRSKFSIATSAIISMFAPFMSSDQPHLFQQIPTNESLLTMKRKARHRRNLSSQMALLTTPAIIVCNLVLFCLLKYSQDFEYGDNVKLQKGTAEALLIMLIFPVGISAILAAISFRKGKTGNYFVVHPTRIDYFNARQIIEMMNNTFLKRISSCLRYTGILLSVVILVALGSATMLINQPVVLDGEYTNLSV